MENKPIKRHDALISFSRDHHFALLLSWKIREGFRKNITLERIKSYTDWFFKNYLKSHFEDEEKYLFSILPQTNKHRKRAISEHRKLEKLFNEKQDLSKSLNLIEEQLEAHIRFEERVLFNEIQSQATTEQLEKIEEIYHHPIEANWKDEFWK